ncbi:MAG: hypothetical protein QF722_01360, partial [Candidatus Thalassarchaeaceae archaeon]|nr:hypothetical protein [Candidatus Thalassarchaeaceae archaeon]
PGQTGEVSVAVDGTLRTLKGRAKDPSEQLNSGNLIRVIDVIGNTLIVEPWSFEDEKQTEEE